VGTGLFDTVVSVPLVLEYEHVLTDPSHGLPHSGEDIRKFLDFICAVSQRKRIHFLWRPCLPDAGDDMVLEAAVNGGCRHIVTFNVRDFEGCGRFGIKALRPLEYLEILGENR
jgi:hypothetical protein